MTGLCNAGSTGTHSRSTAQANGRGWWAQTLGTRTFPLRVFTVANAKDKCPLQSGGQGDVFRARFPDLGPDTVVLKVAKVRPHPFSHHPTRPCLRMLTPHHAAACRPATLRLC